MQKTPFLAVYDYGMGGIWLIIRAHAADKIVEKYPELKVVERRPEWMSQSEYDKIGSKMTFDLADEPSGWLLELVKERNS